MGFWTGKTVVVTGGAGMVGASLVRQLVGEGADVLVLDDFSRGSSIVYGARYQRGDAGDRETALRAFEGAFAVFNLAATVAGVLYNQAHHAGMFSQNIRLQTTPALAAAQVAVPRFLQVSSVCVYAPEHNTCAREENGHLGEPHPANAGYAWAKRMGERVALWAGLDRAVVVRPSNIYGPGDYFDDRAHVIPALIKKCLMCDEIRVHGSGGERREFLYVDDAAAGMMVACERGEPGGIYNLGTNDATGITIRGLVQLIQKATGTTEKPVIFTGGDPGDPARWSDAGPLNALGWRHQVGLVDGIIRTVEWYGGGRAPV